jgi:extracellular factor (EF) 3-hydroxypalmitic acid methyl ester biosynthesis protein
MIVKSEPLLRSVDEAYDMAQAGWVREAMDHLSGALWSLRRGLPPEEWRQLRQGALLEHPMRDVAHRCPIALRSFYKPRGYAGDAVTLDYIYGIDAEESPKPSEERNAAYASRFQAPAARAVRFRRQLMADLVRETRNRDPKAKVLSVAAGHLREAEYALDIEPSEEHDPWWVAFDQDHKSLSVVNECYGRLGVATKSGTVKDIIAGKADLGKNGLVYAAGLFDYLPDAAAVALLKRMIAATTDGGSVMIANFAPDIPDVGYMESYMAWDLIYRNKADLIRIVEAADNGRIDGVQTEADPDRNIFFATMKIA